MKTLSEEELEQGLDDMDRVMGCRFRSFVWSTVIPVLFGLLISNEFLKWLFKDMYMFKDFPVYPLMMGAILILQWCLFGISVVDRKNADKDRKKKRKK